MAESAPFTANMRPACASLNCSFVAPSMCGKGMPMRNASGPTSPIAASTRSANGSAINGRRMASIPSARPRSNTVAAIAAAICGARKRADTSPPMPDATSIVPRTTTNAYVGDERKIASFCISTTSTSR